MNPIDRDFTAGMMAAAREQNELGWLADEERKVMQSVDLTPILGTWQERHRTVLDAAKRLLRDNTDLKARLRQIRERLRSVVCTSGIDAGVVLLSQEGPTHTEMVNGKRIQVYDHEYFSPLGDALMELYRLTEDATCPQP